MRKRFYYFDISGNPKIIEAPSKSWFRVYYEPIEHLLPFEHLMTAAHPKQLSELKTIFLTMAYENPLCQSQWFPIKE